MRRLVRLRQTRQAGRCIAGHGPRGAARMNRFSARRQREGHGGPRRKAAGSDRVCEGRAGSRSLVFRKRLVLFRTRLWGFRSSWLMPGRNRERSLNVSLVTARCCRTSGHSLVGAIKSSDVEVLDLAGMHHGPEHVVDKDSSTAIAKPESMSRLDRVWSHDDIQE
jgi:hypothetical protein